MGGPQKWGSRVPRRLELLQHSGHPPFLLGGGGYGPGSEGHASRGDSASTHARHVLGPGRRPGGEPGASSGRGQVAITLALRAPAFRGSTASAPGESRAGGGVGSGGQGWAMGARRPLGLALPALGAVNDRSERTERRVLQLVICVAARRHEYQTAPREKAPAPTQRLAFYFN